MGATERAENSSLTKRLFSEFYRFTFFQAVTLLEHATGKDARLGSALSPTGEAVRFAVKPGFAFPPSDISKLEKNRGEAPHRLEVSFLGLIGPSGILPRWYNELAMERLSQKDTAFTAFLDIFHHRLISLFYLAWKKYRFEISYSPDVTDRFSRYLRSIIGHGANSAAGRLGIPDEAVLFHSGLLSRQVPTASALEAIVSCHFGIRARVEQLIHRFITLDPEERTALGKANYRLGLDAVCGSRVQDIQSMFRLNLGPMSLEAYNRFLPVGECIRPLISMVRYVVGIEYELEIRVILQPASAPPCILGAKGGMAPRLGWSTWITSPGSPISADICTTFREADVA